MAQGILGQETLEGLGGFVGPESQRRAALEFIVNTSEAAITDPVGQFPAGYDLEGELAEARAEIAKMYPGGEVVGGHQVDLPAAAHSTEALF